VVKISRIDLMKIYIKDGELGRNIVSIKTGRDY